MASHSVYSGESSAQLVGVPLPGRRRTHDSGRSAPHTVAGMLDPARQPQTLEELLERHWEQGSRFLMEQASHFDIASLLSSLHQLKEENLGLEDSVDRLIARRDHLLAVRARLLALNSLAVGPYSGEPRTQPLQNGPSSATDRRLVSPVSSRPLVSPSRDKTLPSPRDRPGPPPLPSPRERRELQSLARKEIQTLGRLEHPNLLRLEAVICSVFCVALQWATPGCAGVYPRRPAARPHRVHGRRHAGGTAAGADCVPC